MSTIQISRYKEDTIDNAGYNLQTSVASVTLGFVIAILLHIGMVLLMVLMQQHAPFDRKLYPSVQVNLVSYSPMFKDLLKSDKEQSKEIETKKSDKKSMPKSKKKLIKKPVAKVVKSVKSQGKKIFDTVKPVKTSKEDVKEQDQAKTHDILSELRKKVEEQEIINDYEEENQSSDFKGWGVTGTDAQNAYNSVLMALINRNWVITEQLAQLVKKDKTITVLVQIKITKTGELEDIWIETKSGNHFLDQAAIRALKKSVPFPPLPSEFNNSSYAVGLIFSPKGL